MTTLSRSPLENWVKAKLDWPDGREMTRQSLAIRQLEKLRATLDYVKYRSPFYRRHFAGRHPQSVRGLRDLGQWPVTTADDLSRDPMAFLCVSQSAVERVVTLPVRSPADRPRRLFFSAADLELAVDFFHRGFSTLVTPGQRMLVLMPCQKPYSVGDLLSRGLARLDVRAIAHGPLQSAEAAVDAILQNQVDCLVGVPSEMAALARSPVADRIASGQIRSIWLGTQNSLRSAVDEISRYWGVPVLQHYGAAEMCPGGGVECAARDGFHLREADLLIEIVDPWTTRPVEDGTYGEVVVTTLTREAMPLVRYRTGHTAAIMRAPCPCGSILRRMTSISPATQETHLRKGAHVDGPHRFNRQ